MLDSIRKRTNGIISTFIILVTAAVMGLWGVDQLNRDGDGPNAGAAAWVNGEMISRRDFAQEYEYKMMQYQSMLGNQFDEKFLAALDIPKRTLDEMIQYKLLAQQAQKLGVNVPDSELRDYIRAIPYFQKNGKFDPELYSKLPNRGLEERRQRERLRLAKFQGYLAGRVRLTPEELKRAYDLKETKIDLDYAKIDFESLAASQKASPAELQSFLKTIPESEIVAAYEAKRRDYTEPAAVELNQIRVGIPFQASAEKKAEAKKKIEAIVKELTPENFAEVAKKQSDDEYSKKGGKVGWVNRGSLETPLEDAIDKLEVNRLSGPIETSFGYYVLKLSAKREAKTQPLEQVKNRVAESLMNEKKKKAFIEAKKAEWNRLLAEGKNLEPELKKLKVEVKKTGSFSLANHYLPNIGQADAILDAVFNLSPSAPVGKQLVEFGGYSYYVKLRTIERAKAADFEKNREQVEKSVETQLQSELVNQWISTLQKSATVKTSIDFGKDKERSAAL